MFSTTWCGYCARLKAQLTKAGVGYREIDIETEPGTAELVQSINNGNQTVPTVLFPDGYVGHQPVAGRRYRASRLTPPHGGR